MYEHAPQAVEAFPSAEIVGHGRSNSERQGKLSEAQEHTLIAETTAAIERHCSARPSGWLGPWISQSHVTPDLLQEAGYAYLLDWCHDDQSVWMKTRNGRILSLPYPQEFNDIPQIVTRKRDGPEFADMIVDAFDVMHPPPSGDGRRAASLSGRLAAPFQASGARVQTYRCERG
jgi:allantoinase